jgi:glycosyltransferase involved in cell wall biosynthesis
MLRARDFRTIHLGIDLSRFRPGNQLEARQQLGLPSNAFVMFAAFHPLHSRYKDLPTVEQAATIVAQTKPNANAILLIAGGNRVPNLNPIVRFLGDISDPDEMARCFRAADVFLHGAHAENFPLSVLEALACGIPVVATNVGGIAEQFVDGVHGCLVPRGDAQAMAARICSLIDQSERRHSMGNTAVVWARAQYDLARYARDYVAWFQELVSPRHGDARSPRLLPFPKLDFTDGTE